MSPFSATGKVSCAKRQGRETSNRSGRKRRKGVAGWKPVRIASLHIFNLQTFYFFIVVAMQDLVIVIDVVVTQ